MIADTMSPPEALRALTALGRDTDAWVITSSMSLGSTLVSSTSSLLSSWHHLAQVGGLELFSSLRLQLGAEVLNLGLTKDIICV
jgi:hypothetical protein